MCPKHNSRCEELGKSVADGKELLATTISEYVDTASDATWDIISENIKSAIEKNKFTFKRCDKIKFTASADVDYDHTLELYPKKYTNAVLIKTFIYDESYSVRWTLKPDDLNGYPLNSVLDFMLVRRNMELYVDPDVRKIFESANISDGTNKEYESMNFTNDIVNIHMAIYNNTLNIEIIPRTGYAWNEYTSYYNGSNTKHIGCYTNNIHFDLYWIGDIEEVKE